MLCKEKIAVRSEIDTKYKSAMWAPCRILAVKPGGK